LLRAIAIACWSPICRRSARLSTNSARLHCLAGVAHHGAQAVERKADAASIAQLTPYRQAALVEDLGGGILALLVGHDAGAMQRARPQRRRQPADQ
jgi:hypothetical protein